MGKQLNTNVTVADDGGAVYTFGPGDEVPGWAVEKIDNPGVWADGGGEAGGNGGGDDVRGGQQSGGDDDGAPIEYGEADGGGEAGGDGGAEGDGGGSDGEAEPKSARGKRRQ